MSILLRFCNFLFQDLFCLVVLFYTAILYFCSIFICMCFYHFYFSCRHLFNNLFHISISDCFSPPPIICRSFSQMHLFTDGKSWTTCGHFFRHIYGAMAWWLRHWIPIQESRVQNQWAASRSTQPFIPPRSIKWAPEISGNLVVKKCLLEAALALRQLNPIHKKEP